MMTVHEVARLAGVSERTLRYYDQLGLLPPASATEAGYRLYSEKRPRAAATHPVFAGAGFSAEGNRPDANSRGARP